MYYLFYNVDSYVFQFLWGWNLYQTLVSELAIDLSIPLRMKPDSNPHGRGRRNTTFNSFEDETVYPCLPQGTVVLVVFQFLWGWNIFEIPEEDVNTAKSFQFLWGWNSIPHHSCLTP